MAPRVCALLVLILALGLGGCHRSEKTNPRDESGPGSGASGLTNPSEEKRPAPLPYRGASNDGTFHVTYLPTPDPIPLNEPFELEVIVFEDADFQEPATNITLHVDAAMPQHQHGMNQEPTVEGMGGGRFRGKNLLFHMSGYWELYFDVTRGPVTERAQFMVQLD